MLSNFNLKAKNYLDSPNLKRYYNQKHFTESAPKYDFATKMLSLGRDSSWKKELIKLLPQMQSPLCVDIACGTGDVAFELAKKFPDGRIVGLDLTPLMIDHAIKRNSFLNSFSNIEFVVRDMCSTELDSNSVDILTGSYAIRNAPNLDDALKEVYRVLKPGGFAGFLDFSKPESKIMQHLQYYLLKIWGSFCGLVLHRNPEVHGYIAASMKDFPDRAHLKNIFENNKLRVVQRKKLYFGMLEVVLLQK